MVSVALTLSTLLYLAPEQECARLRQQLPHHRIISTPRIRDVEALLHEYAPAALIAPFDEKTLKLFKRVRSRIAPDAAPLLVLITDDPDDAPTEAADLVISTKWLASTLAPMLKLREENHALRHQAYPVESDLFDDDERDYRRGAEEINLLKNAIVRAVSHELRTPMLQVKGAVAMLLDKNHALDHEKLADYALGATTRLENVIKNVTLLAESLDIELQPAQVNDAVSQALRNLRRSWEHKDNVDRIRVELPRNLPIVLADKQGIGVVLQLLLDNALKFSSGDVFVSAQAFDDGVRIAVRDNGIGIAPTQLKTIFEPFYQIDHTETRRFGGVGVGLTIVRLILERHNTIITVESTLGKRSIFTFTLPYADL